MARDELVVNKGGKTRRATDRNHYDRLIKGGWRAGYKPKPATPKPPPSEED